jgi:uncharacterized SAM-binding protein YcdF (DUF218 family)
MGCLWRLARWLVGLLLLGAALYLGGPWLLTASARALISADRPSRADLGVILAGNPFLTVPEAARLYHEGQVGRILLPRPPRPAGQEELLRVGLRYPDELELSRRLLEELRVPSQAILAVSEWSDGLAAEAQAAAAFVKGRSERTLILVGSKVQSARARRLFQRELDPSRRLLVHPVPSDPFDPAAWWRSPRGRQEVCGEYLGLGAFWARRAWEALRGQPASLSPDPAGRSV